MIEQSASAIDLVEGTPWSSGVRTFIEEDEPAQVPITWSYANGILSITDGTPDLTLDFNVGAGGRVLTYSGLSDDNTVDLVIATRLQ